MKKLILLIVFFSVLINITYSQSGKPDLSFGINGIVTTDLGSAYDYTFPTKGKQVFLQKDGAMCVLLELEYSGQSVITKRLSNGSLDTGYGNKGFSGSVALKVPIAAMQPDGKIVVAGNDFRIARFNADGSVDSAFGIGKHKVSFSEGYLTIAYAIAIQSDGKILVAGQTELDPNGDVGFAIVRYNIDGSLDDTFSKNGMQTTSFNAYSTANSIAIQGDGKIIIAGNTSANGGTDFALVRYNANGNPDSTFATNGKQTTDFGNNDYAYSIAIQSDGKIVVAGGSGNGFAIARYNINGTLDRTFSGDGKQITDFGNDDNAKSLAIQSDRKIVVAGVVFKNFNNDFAIARYNVDGSPDLSFSADGKLTTDFNSGSNDDVNSITLQTDGKILAVGSSSTPDAFAIARYNYNGTLDNTFDEDGKLTDIYYVKQGNSSYKSLAIQPDGKIVAAGKMWNGNNFDFAVTSYNADGSLNNSFSGDGKQNIDFDSTNDESKEIAIQSNGKITVHGSADDGSNYRSAIARVNTNGTLDKTFSGDGKLKTSLANTVTAVQPDGKIVEVSSLLIGTEEDYVYAFYILRYNVDGTPDNSFSGDGKQTIDFSSPGIKAYAFPYSVAIQSDGKIVVAGEVSKNYDIDFAIARLNTDGSLDKSFSGDGMVTTAFTCDDPENGCSEDQVYSVIIQNDGKILAAGQTFTYPIYYKIALARYNTDGSVDRTFGTDGKTADIPGYNLVSPVLQADGKIVLACTNSNYDDQSNPYNNTLVLVRYNTNGKLDSTFSADGIKSFAPGINIASIAIANDKLYAAGFSFDAFNVSHAIIGRYLLHNDNNPPAINIISPENNQTIPGPVTIHLEADASDADGRITKVEFYSGLVLLKTEYKYPYTYSWKNVRVGSYIITAKATDNFGAITISAPVNFFISQNTPPIVNITSPANGESFAAPANIPLIASAQDPDGSITKVVFYSGSTLIRTETKFPYSYQWQNVSAGTYTITAAARDDNGFTTTSPTVTFTVTSHDTPLVSNRPISNNIFNLTLSPNPAKNSITLYTSGLQPHQQTSVSVISFTGVVLQTFRLKSSSQATQMNVAYLPSGVYTIKLLSGGKVISRKFLKL